MVGTLLRNHDNVQNVTLVPRGQARGLTWFMPNEDPSLVTIGQIVALIVGALVDVLRNNQFLAQRNNYSCFR